MTPKISLISTFVYFFGSSISLSHKKWKNKEKGEEGHGLARVFVEGSISNFACLFAGSSKGKEKEN